jgi:hypothetical protein
LLKNPPHPNSVLLRSRCERDGCSKRGALLRVRTNRRTFREERARLCGDCAKKGAWSKPSYERIAVMPL